ncbi:TPA: oligopeptide ABC transporter substrate-binding protein [Streptococcus suis]|uniref:oligopeptide ABC transporter substrate-binding protein n=1 Tax=Streptococcus suis TaxID=1307 RepID=UPI001ABECFF2|nr:oligopeptide ABC transporter substrate-binding protein [Streptococcus suis]MBO4110164.1 oligopeptide ABC transporter substrate-binding protein [Streptococcus suis]MDG3136830.1 oligopeptide ABC transporter substrate-binding protein [Streptococcus suis]HEM3614982.1 oligopeptide ABC transporter substrate-binding protein [Streptococcus suis]HEM3636189.1 oligopeptide ABC transporter substrate-binding protein [Streptococcus suis]HEM3642936.1 oligopeptide ABC transporter substrate-binding protein 
MKKTKLISLAGVALLSASVLAACGSKSSSGAKQDLSFPSEVTNEGTAIKGGQLNYAVVSANSATGILHDELYSTALDAEFLTMVDSSMFGYDGNRKLNDSGLAKVDFDIEGKKVTVTLTGKDYKWSDGTPFTIDDYIFTIESLANPAYPGVRFGDGHKNIIGVDEYHAGTADSISGIEKVDDYTVVLHVKQMTPSMTYSGGDVPAFVMPKHIFKDIPIADWEGSEYSRTAKYVGMGPFKVKDVTSGESITFVANEYYYKGKPKIDSVKVDIVSPDTIVSEVKAGKYDIVEMPEDQFDSYKDLSNIKLTGAISPSYEYISFNMGTYDQASGKNVMDAKAKMNDVKLRQAIAYAIDPKTAGEKLYNGLYHQANSLIISFFGDVHDSELEGYSYNPEKAKKLLDEAGYKDVDGDGIREGKDGKEFKISFAARKRTDANEALVQQYIAWWKEVGLNVELYTGRTMELNSFYTTIEANDANIDMFAGGWGTGHDPNPTGLYGPDAPFNYSRFVSDENTKLLEALNSVEAFDHDTSVKDFYAWQKYAAEQAYAIPVFERETLVAVNNRVKYYDRYFGSDSKSSWEQVELLADKGEAAK